MAESFGVEDRGSFYDAVGALRDVVQNHVLQMVAILAMELPDRADGQSWQDARVAALAAIAPVSTDTIVRGQYDGYHDIEGVARDSQTETYIALRLEIDTPRWRGVPFCVRAGKRLPVTMTEAYSEYAPPGGTGSASHVRFALGPGRCDIGVAVGSMQKTDDAPPPELRVGLGHDDDCNAYVSLLDAALRGDTSYSERADGVFAAWRAVEPALHAALPVHPYAPGSWGPREADRVVPPGSRWHDPVV
jgi:glucose-6-phosphate 1-dehydrogenase